MDWSSRFCHAPLERVTRSDGKSIPKGTATELESSMSSVQIEQKSYEMPPREGISIAHFLTVADIERSARYYEKVFGARILSHR